MRLKTKTLLSLLPFLIASCSLVDNHLLGKDNTKPPAPLKAIDAKVSIQQEWSVSVGSGVFAHHYAKLAPEIVDNIIYTAFTDGTVSATDIKNGKTIWRNKLDDGILSGPTVQGQYIALALTNAKACLLNAKTGQILWKKNLSGEVFAKPLIAHDKVFYKTVQGYVYALTIEKGSKVWGVEHGSPSLILKTSASPVLHHNTLFVGHSDGKLDAIDLDYGHVIWQKNIAYGSGASDVEQLVDIDSNPIIIGNTIYIGTYQGSLMGVSLETAETTWKKPASIFKDITLNKNKFYFTDANDKIWSVDALNGQTMWHQIHLEARGLTEPVVLGGYVIVGDKTGYLHVLSKSTGDIVGREYTGKAMQIAPVTDGQHLFVLASNGQLTRYELRKS